MSSEVRQHFRSQVGMMSKEQDKDFIIFFFPEVDREICSQ